MLADFIIRRLKEDELVIPLHWAELEGWNPGLYDAQCFYAADTQGFFVGELRGQPIATFSAVNYGEFGFIGLFIVKPEYRKQFYAPALARVGADYLKNCASIGLDGVIERQANYHAFGFRFSHRNIRYQKQITQVSKTIPATVVSLDEVPLASVLAYDRRCFPAPRSNFIKQWINQPQSRALGVVEYGRLLGMGVIRTCCTGYKIGPLFADNQDIAELLLLALQKHLPHGTIIYLDVPSTNNVAMQLVAKNQMGAVFETARMYSGTPPTLAWQNVFGITTFELG